MNISRFSEIELNNIYKNSEISFLISILSIFKIQDI